MARLFSKLSEFRKNGGGGMLSLRHRYVNGLGAYTAGATAIGKFLASDDTCDVASVCLSHNPVGHNRAIALDRCLPRVPHWSVFTSGREA